MTLLQRTIEDSVTTLRGLTALEEPLNRAAQIVLRCLTSGHKLLVCGNGGSALSFWRMWSDTAIGRNVAQRGGRAKQNQLRKSHTVFGIASHLLSWFDASVVPKSC